MTVKELLLSEIEASPDEMLAETLNFLRFLKFQQAQQEANVMSSSKSKKLADYSGILKDSPNFNGDPVEIQEEMRNEWS